MSGEGLCNIGTLCKEFYKERAYAIGFGCYQGKVIAASQWEGPGEIKEIPPAHPESYEHLFFETGLKQFSLHLQGEVKEHLLKKRPARGIGTIYHPESDRLSNYNQTCLPELFDEYIWFDTTSPVKAI
jgi:protein-L-isoaspartate(D-aspartate) O-methyltransferase